MISVRTALTIRFFPRIFFLYFTLFHVYFFSFPSGFSHLALLTTMSLLVHAMLYFWNRFEVSALPSVKPYAQAQPSGSIFPAPSGPRRRSRRCRAVLSQPCDHEELLSSPR